MQPLRRREEAELSHAALEDLVNEDLLLAVLAGRLTPNQADMLIDTTMLGLTGRELAAEYGLSEQRVRQVLRDARQKIRLRAFPEQAAA